MSNIPPIKRLLSVSSSEHKEQVAVVDFCNALQIPVAAVPNGFWTQKRDKQFYAMLNKLKKEGLSPGFKDLIVFPGTDIVFIEMKRKVGGILSDDQLKWDKILTERGHNSHICAGADEGICVIKQYLGKV